MSESHYVFPSATWAEGEYLLGWMACDGSLGKNGLTIGLQIQSRDVVVLNLFCRITAARRDNDRVLKGRSYVGARRHSRVLWNRLNQVFKGRLKEEKHFPTPASTEFVLGCLDADGSFFRKRNGIEGEFQHRSENFRKGMKQWLDAHGVKCSERPARNRILFSFSGCRKLAQLYSLTPFGLRRKADVLANWPEKPACYWTFQETQLLRKHIAEGYKVAGEKIGRSEKAVQLKVMRMRRKGLL